MSADSSISTLERIAELLEPEPKARLLSLASRFRSAPEDDEYLLMLEAIGLMSLLWKEVPNEIRSILEKSNPVTDTCHSVGRQVREAVVEAIPSYEDLTLISKRLEEHELALKRILSSKAAPTTTPLLSSLLMLAAGVIIGWIAHPHLHELIPW